METEPLTIDVYVRAHTSVTGPREHAIETVEELVDRGVVADYELHTWPSAVDVTVPNEVTTQYREFEQWAERAGVTLEPAFSHRIENNAITGDHIETLVTPLVCTVVRRGDDIAAVLPCCRGESDHVSVLTYLSALDEDADHLVGEKLPTPTVA
ncbi:HTH domain-containing protein [Haloarchaeobius sp. FL176]|uniref:HTH domain-containing protein n=1 Tax=Haloarchaeobius sp. FL176 TaxID=2967129 RepID=UPI0021492F33|nr:HTH domain-containing protein [Haloarchaeobius sp. FL176]